MYFSEETLDDLMNKVITVLVEKPLNVTTTRGTSSEIIGTLLELKNPRARLSRSETKGTAFSALGELIWYLSKSNDIDFISYYLPKYRDDSQDGVTLHGAYGPRLYNLHAKYNQVQNVINLLKKRPTSRKAVIQIFDGEDVAEGHKEFPCTCTLQFLIRENKLHMFTSMRSNDAFLGLPHDIFAFTMMQEILARHLDVELGSYNHAVGSLHLYEDHLERAKMYLSEGYQSTISMPEMPIGNPEEALNILIESESKIRLNQIINISDLEVDSYWSDLMYMLQILSFYRKNDYKSIEEKKALISNPIYKVYIDDKIKKMNENEHRV
jgi:thymidylate synthase